MRTLALMVSLVLILTALTGYDEAMSILDSARNGGSGDTYSPAIDPADFSAEVTNPYFPLTPGTTYVYEGETEEGPEHVEVTVTHHTKQILGVTCVEVRDVVSVEGEVIEDTLDWYAQDREGNVWYFGEDVKNYEGGVVVDTAGSWEAGVDGAQPGIIMQADPQPGEPYRQEFYEGEAEDMAEVLSLGESADVPYGSFRDCLKTREWTPLEPGFTEHKYYAPGIGHVLTTVVEGEAGRVELMDVIKE